jgi:HSP20 family protein
MDRLFDNVFRGIRSPLDRAVGAAETNEGAMELYETADELTAYIYAPGIPQDSFDISATEDTITVKAERKPLFEPTDGITSHTPWSSYATSSGSISTNYSLPSPIDPAKVQASYKEGVLQIRMPKHETTKPKQVKIEVG